jgi:hypothetical protein
MSRCPDRKENTRQPQLCSMPAAPFRPILLAIARAIPLDVPVTSATLPSSDMDFWDFLSRGGQVRTVSAVNVVAVLRLQLINNQDVASVNIATFARQTVRAVHLAGRGV